MVGNRFTGAASAKQGAAPAAFAEERTIQTSRRCGPKTQDSTYYEPFIDRNRRKREPFNRRTCLVCTSATSRQSCEHFRPCYRTLTRLFKLIATAQWQGCRNRAATARREFRGVKWNPAGPLPGRAVRERIVQARLRARGGSTLSHCQRVLRPPMPRRTKACALSI